MLRYFPCPGATFFLRLGYIPKDAQNPNQTQGSALRRTFMPLRERLQHSLFSRVLFGKALFRKAALATAALGGLFLFAGVPSAMADNCQRRIARAEHELGEAIEDHGYNSRQANYWRYERHEAYEACQRERNYYRDEGRRYYRDQDGNYYYRDERGNYYRYDGDRDRYYRDSNRDRHNRRERDWDDD